MVLFRCFVAMFVDTFKNKIYFFISKIIMSLILNDILANGVYFSYESISL